MKLLCAWCLKEGKRALMGECPPLDDPSETHAICPEHRQQVEAELETLRKKTREDLEGLRKRQEEDLEDLRKKVDP
ncbi:MAG: hypothetical protein ABSD47_04905 [Candidatus Methylomirabilota bacterium]